MLPPASHEDVLYVDFEAVITRKFPHSIWTWENRETYFTWATLIQMFILHKQLL